MSRDSEIIGFYQSMFDRKMENKLKQPEGPPPQIKENFSFAREDQYDRIVSRAKKIFVDRNKKYGDAITDTGVLGAVVAMAGDYGRLRNMVLKTSDHGRSQRDEVMDKLLDNFNQVAIAIMMLEEDNWEGR